MSLLVDTSVWSLAFRRDRPSEVPQVQELRRALEGSEQLWTTGVILQELLQGIQGPRASTELIKRFASLPFVVPDRQDHIEAAVLHSACRRKGIQLGTIDALIASLCIRHELTLLSTDGDFQHARAHCALNLWQPA